MCGYTKRRLGPGVACAQGHLAACRYMGMTAQPEPVDGAWVGGVWVDGESVDGVGRTCPECSGPIEDGPAFRICQGCYDAYVTNAGR